MKYLFLHQSFPGQFYHVIKRLGENPNNEVVFICFHRSQADIPGVKCYTIDFHPVLSEELHHYIYGFQNAVAQGSAVHQGAAQLKQQGFYPDVIVGHSGWGCNFYMKDLFPQAKLIAYCEWFFHARNSEIDFDPARPVDYELACLTRTANAAFLLDLANCDAALSPTYWQKQQFPQEFQEKIAVIHEGVDTEFYQPRPKTRLILPQLGLDLSGCDEIITYVARGKDLYRGFPQFMEMLGLLLEWRPNCQAVIVGGDDVAYGPRPEGLENYKQQALHIQNLDWSRVHFTGMLNKEDYRQVLQASAVHVYLTYPFVLSWSLLEAMSSGCLLLASNTAPVREVIEEGVNGFLVDFFSVQELATKAGIILANQSKLAIIRERARKTIQEKYDVNDMIPLELNFFEQVYSGK